MKICICDDDKSQCERLKKMIMKHSSTHEIIFFHSAEEMLFECEDTYPFDCIFMDIQMDKINGIDCARKIRENDQKILIVFLSAIGDYVFEGYEVNAIRYLLKPLREDQCHALLDLIQNSIQKESSYLYIHKTKINCDEITYIESFKHYCTIHGNHVMEAKISISELLNKLPSSFIQTHRSYIVNLSHVDAIQKDQCLLDSQEMVPISRSSIKKVNEAFMEYIKGEMVS